ncbi:MAG TPA: DivIVA domain-containing protein [Acidimicrobiales bacterium]|nr:DivIVA domain-containing protein [Acidimicrobiales bacterium]
MDLSSSLAGTKEFRIVKRGYDPDEVDAFLDQIALGVAELKRKLVESGDQAPAPAATPEPSRADAEEIHRALILAQRAADEEVRKAAAEGEAVVAEARERAAELLREADRDVSERREQARVGLLDEISGLEARRDGLAADVVVLERHVDEQREVVQAAVGELQSLLDHPEAFRVAPAGAPGAGPAPGTTAPVAPTPPPATAEAAGGDDDDEEGDAAAVAADQPADEDQHAPLPGRDDLAHALNLHHGDEDDEAIDLVEPPVDTGPPTQALDQVEAGEDDDDAFLAELRKAMLDDEPLGPRDAALLPGPRAEEVARPRARFGRRR